MRQSHMIEHDVINAESNRSERHGIRTHHPVFVRKEIFIVGRGFKSFQRGIKPEDGHEHKTDSLPYSSFSKKCHVKPGRRADEQDHEHINFAGDDVDFLSFFQDPGRKLHQGGENTERSGSDVDIKAKFPNRFTVQYFPCFKERHTGIERNEIWNGVEDQEQAKEGDRNPEQHKHPEGDGVFC